MPTVDVTFERLQLSDDSDVFSFVGYSGGMVNLRDYGLDAPAVYDVKSIGISNSNLPMLYEHKDPVGHTLSFDNSAGQLAGEGTFSIDNDRSREIRTAREKKFPYQMSMGLEVNDAVLEFIPEGQKLSVNEKEFTGPFYLFRNTELSEMTICVRGRDRNTALLSKDNLMTLKNSHSPLGFQTILNTAPGEVTPPEPVVPPVVENTPPPVVENTPPPVPPVPPTEVPYASFMKLSKLINNNPRYAEFIENSIDSGLGLETIENQLNVLKRNDSPQLPGGKEIEAKTNLLSARFDYAMGLSLETLVKTHGEKLTEQAQKLSLLSPKEMISEIANSNGGRFNGHSDVEDACKFLKQIHNTNSYSGVDMPNFFVSTAQRMKEEMWKIEAPFALSHLKEVNMKDFRPKTSLRAGGGELWEKLTDKNKIMQTKMGKETPYVSELDTVAQLLIFDRKTLLNDDMEVIEDLMNGMVEGAVMVPDAQLMNLVWENRSAGFNVLGTSYFKSTTAVLNRANLSTIYNIVRNVSIQKGTKTWNNVVKQGWYLVVGTALEETAWELINQERIVNDTTANTKTGEKNYWYNRLEPVTWNQIGNTSLAASAEEDDWMIIPKDPRYAPYSISFLGKKKDPTIESVDLPAEMLGMGVRGFWDLNVQEREAETVAICRPSKS